MSRVSLKLYNNYESFKETYKDFKHLALKHQVITSLAIIALSFIMFPVAPFVIPNIFTRLVTFFKRPVPDLPPEMIMKILNFVDTPTLAGLAEYQCKSVKSKRSANLMHLSRVELFKREHSFLPDQSPLVLDTMMICAENITELNLFGFSIAQEKLGCFFARSKNLKSLSLNGLEISKLPGNLKTLNLIGDSSFKITDKWIKQLPRSLETFSIQKGSFSTVLKSFPDTLRHLHTGECTFVEPIDILPKNLESLTIFYSYPHLLEKLPTKLTKLSLQSIGCSELQDEDLKLLPKNVTYLELKCCSEITNKGLATLSSSLKHLSLWYCKKITDECFPYLPKSLQSLEFLGDCSSQRLEKINQNISSLPKSLTTLSLTHLNWLQSECIAWFPPNLTQLNVAYSFQALNHKNIKELPKGLKTLILSKNCNLLIDPERALKALNKRNIIVQFLESSSKKDLCA